MRLLIAYSKIKKRNLVLINNDTNQRETLSERPIGQPLRGWQPPPFGRRGLMTEYLTIMIIMAIHLDEPSHNV